MQLYDIEYVLGTFKTLLFLKKYLVKFTTSRCSERAILVEGTGAV